MAARKSLSVADCRAIALQMLAPDRPRGTPGELAQEYDISRQMTYYWAGRADRALASVLIPTHGPKPHVGVVTITPVRLQRAVTLLSLVGVSQRDTLLVLDELLDTRRSPGYVAQVLARAETLAAARNAELRPALSGLLAADEMFLHSQPILGVIHPASMFLVSLTLATQRDGTTWGCEFLNNGLSGKIISDAGSGLAAGAALAEMECHAGDWFHPLLAAAYVETQYERRAYAALSKVYAREEQLLQTSTAKRWENHWQKYLVECAAADQAIERYDQWRQLRWQLRALASQCDWTTGVVRKPETVKTALHALAVAFARLAEGVQAQALVSLLQQQADALTAVLPLLAQALTPVAITWGEEATRVVCRLWQALQEYACPAWLPAQRKQLEQAITDSLAWASTHLGDRLSTLQHLVAAILAQWPRTSSSIECLNSLLRPYLEGRKQVSQGFLELFRFYHNTHRFVRGKRAGASPLELAGDPHISDPLAFLGLGTKS
jgi:hypothetical protein